MALIDLSSGRVQAFRDTMRHQNSVFHAVVKHIPWQEFDRSVAMHRANARVRRLTTKSQSWRCCLASFRARLTHRGLRRKLADTVYLIDAPGV